MAISQNNRTNPIIGKFVGKCADIVMNNNGMKLETELWESLFASEEYKMNLERGMYIGFLGHPEEVDCQDFRNACIILKEAHIDSDGQVYGEFDLIDTPVGRIVKTFIDAGVQFGISVRGAGQVAADGYVNPDTFDFRGFDLVAFPAYDDAVPEFEKLVASTDTKKRSVYQSICSAIKKDVNNITSSSALEEMKYGFNEQSEQYKLIDDRISELSSEPSASPVYGPENDDLLEGEPLEDLNKVNMILKDKLDAVLALYVESRSEIRRLKSELRDVYDSNRCLKSDNSALKRTVKSSNRIMYDQLQSVQSVTEDLEYRLQDSTEDVMGMEDEISRLEGENRSLKSDNSSLKKKNLKYSQKIKSATATIDEKDDVIASLQSRLRKTVTKNRRLQDDASNRDDEAIKSLESKIEANTRIITEYQDAYAALYARAIGVDLNTVAIPVTAATSVKSMEDLIENSGYSGANLDDYDEIQPEFDYEDSEVYG